MKSILSEARLSARDAILSSPPSRPLVFAHRGGARWRRRTRSRRSTTAWRSAPTASSSTSACRATASSSSITIATLERTTNLRGAVAARTAAELARADAGYHFARRRLSVPRPGIGVPTLADVLDALPRRPRSSSRSKVNSAALARRRRRRRPRPRTRSIASASASFGLRVLRAARALEPAIATSAAREEVRWALYRSWCRWPVSRVAYARLSDPRVAGTHPRRLAAVHRRRASRRPWRPGLDGRRRGRRAAAA